MGQRANPCVSSCDFCPSVRHYTRAHGSERRWVLRSERWGVPPFRLQLTQKTRGAIKMFLPSKSTSLIYQLHASVFSMKLRFFGWTLKDLFAHKCAILLQQCDGWIIKTWRRGSTFDILPRFLASVVTSTAVWVVHQLFYTAYCIITERQTVSRQLQ